MRIALTGATGLIGRNLLFEIIKMNFNDLDKVEVFVLGRSRANATINERIERIIAEDGVFYIGSNRKQDQSAKDQSKKAVTCVEINLEEDGLGIKPDDHKRLSAAPIDIFYHVAASTDLRNAPGVEQLLERANVFGTQQILKLIATLKIGQFCYVGTAYSCGNVSGRIQPDVLDANSRFRSPYEKSKLDAETLVRAFSKKTGVRCRYFRPSVTCGRLIEQPLGSISKFDVIYGWGSFFFQMKLKYIKSFEDRYTQPVELNIRTCYNLKSGLNIVPADYAAKVMYHVCMQNDPGESYHLVNNAETPHALYMAHLLRAFNVQGVTHVEHIPNDLNHLEKLYYKTAGKVFTPYINAQPMLFIVDNLKNVCAKAKLSCPPVDEKTLPVLVEFAKKQDFGVIKNNSVSSKITAAA